MAVYGFAPPGTDETGGIHYFNDYGRTKYLAEEEHRAWLREKPENCAVIVRPTVIFGEGNRGNVYNLLRQMAGGRFPMVGRGTNRKSMNYVENVAALIEWCVAHETEPGTLSAGSERVSLSASKNHTYKPTQFILCINPNICGKGKSIYLYRNA